MEPRYRRCDGVVVRQITGETVLVPTRGDLARSECLYVLDSPVARQLWQCLETATSLQALCDHVLESFQVSVEEAAADVDEFVADLAAAGLIVKVG